MNVDQLVSQESQVVEVSLVMWELMETLDQEDQLELEENQDQLEFQELLEHQEIKDQSEDLDSRVWLDFLVLLVRQV